MGRSLVVGVVVGKMPGVGDCQLGGAPMGAVVGTRLVGVVAGNLLCGGGEVDESHSGGGNSESTGGSSFPGGRRYIPPGLL